MKVKDFIKELQKFDPEAEVLGQIDPEGNGFFRAGVDGNAFFSENDDLLVHNDDWTADNCCLDEDEYQKLKKKNRCVVVYPE